MAFGTAPTLFDSRRVLAISARQFVPGSAEGAQTAQHGIDGNEWHHLYRGSTRIAPLVPLAYCIAAPAAITQHLQEASGC